MKGKLRLLAITAVLVLVMLPVGGVSAQPPIPQLFTGTVTIGGAPAPVGTTVSAWIEGVQVESVDTTAEGEYDMDIYPDGHVGKMVVFRVNGVVGGQTTFIDPKTFPMVTCNLVTYTLSVTIEPVGGGAVDLDPPDGDAVTPGAQYPSVDPVTVTLTADAAAGYQFKEWSGALSGTASTRTLLMDGNKAVTAHFEEILPDRYALTMAASPAAGGTATDLTNASPYIAGAEVSIKAQAAAGYRFVNWTAPAGVFGNANAAETTFTMPAQAVTVTANFEEIPPERYALAMAADPQVGGTAVDLTGDSPYEEGTEVSIRAVAAAGYRFVNWTAPAGVFGNANAAETTFTMPAQAVTVTAHFEEIPTYELTMAEDPEIGGTATDLTDDSPYAEGTEVNIRAVAAAGYRFVNWTAPAGVFANANAAETTFTMPTQPVTVTANFVPVYALNMAASPAAGGTATDLTNASPYTAGTEVSTRAVAAAGYRFVNWTAPAGVFGNANAEETTFTMPAQAVTVTANFEDIPRESVETGTGTGTAYFSAGLGIIEDLGALPEIPPEPPAGVEFPHGMFSFRVTGLTPGQEVTITIELPEAVPAGTRWWKHQDGAWYELPIGTTADPKVITITLTDGVFPGDADKIADGVITDPGGPGVPTIPAVGGTAYPVSRLPIMALWIALAAIIAGGSLLLLRRRQAL